MKFIARRMLPPKIAARVRSWILGRRRARFSVRQVIRRYGDKERTIELIDARGQSWYDRDIDFDPEMKVLSQRRLKPGATVFDIGAHQGIVALMLAEIVGRDGKVVAVEANPADAHASMRNQELNRCEQLIVKHAAIAATHGTISFQICGRVSGSNDKTSTIQVNTCTIDGLAEQHGPPDVLFIDVDGAELEALRGASAVLQSRPDIYLEIHPPYLKDQGATVEEVLSILIALRYRLMASQEMTASRRSFEEWDQVEIDLNKCFHVLALEST